MHWRLLTFIVILSTVIHLLSSCTVTKDLWDSYDPNEWIWIPANEITEEALLKKGLDYQDATRDSGGGGYMVEKTKLVKLHDYTMLTLGTPVAVFIDSVPLIVYLGALYQGNEIHVEGYPKFPWDCECSDKEEKYNNP
ncbi:hypothetical protein ACFL3F_00180 [Planctomycetota bacterium]